MQLILQGKILPPIISKKTSSCFSEFHTRILKPHRRYYNKIIASRPTYPYSLICYLGKIEVRCLCKTRKKNRTKTENIT